MNYKKGKTIAKIGLTDIILVMLQFILLLLFFILPESWSLPFGAYLWPLGYTIMFSGFILVAWASINLRKELSPFPSPKEHANLVTTGAFKCIRHPIYAGILLGMLGMALLWNSATKITMTIIGLCFFYAKATYEERKLSEKFKDYEVYKKRTGMFFPIEC